MDWYLEPWRKYATFSGRARRREFWVFALAPFLVFGALQPLVGSIIGDQAAGILYISLQLYWLAALLPLVAVAVRRLHDGGRSGWWVLAYFVPLIGWIVLLVLLLLDSQPGENQYSPSPTVKTAGADSGKEETVSDGSGLAVISLVLSAGAAVLLWMLFGVLDAGLKGLPGSSGAAFVIGSIGPLALVLNVAAIALAGVGFSHARHRNRRLLGLVALGGSLMVLAGGIWFTYLLFNPPRPDGALNSSLTVTAIVTFTLAPATAAASQAPPVEARP